MGLTLHRFYGDTCRLAIPMVHPDTGLPFDGSGSVFLASCKNKASDPDTAALIQKISRGGGITIAGTVAFIDIVPENWARLVAGKSYVFDLQAQQIADGAVFTVAEWNFMGIQGVTRGLTSSVPIYTINPPAPFSLVPSDIGAETPAGAQAKVDALASTVAAALLGLSNAIAGREAALGNPPVDGYVLCSTAAGERYWALGGTGEDTSNPLVTSINRQTPGDASTNAASVVFRMLTSKTVTGVDVSDFTLTATGTAAGTVASILSSNGRIFDITVNNLTGTGTLRLDLKSSDTGIVDGSGNALAGFTAGQVYAIDRDAPTVLSINRLTPSGASTNAASVVFRMTTSESVSGVDVGDFTLTASGTAAGTVASISAVSPTIYDVTVNGTTGAGTLRLDLNDSGTGIVDGFGNTVAAGFTGGETYSLDRVAPTVMSINRLTPSGATTDADSVIYRMTTSKSVSGVEVSDFTLTGTDTAGGIIASVSAGSGTIFDITVEGLAGTGTLRLDLNGSGTSIVDGFGNALAGFTSGQTYNFDRAATLNHLIVIGQSNGSGGQAFPLFQTTAPRGYMFNGGVMPGASSGNLASLVAYQEAPHDDRNSTGQACGQTVGATLISWLAANLPSTEQFLVSNVSASAWDYAYLKKGTAPYNDSLAQVTAAKALALAAGKKYRVIGLICIHGEQDSVLHRTDYATNVVQWQTDYDTDIKAITGQSEMVALFACQAHSAPAELSNPTLAGASDVLLYNANRLQPSKVVLVAPEYMLDFNTPPHFSPFSHAWLGEYFAKAVAAAFFDGSTPEPIAATSAVLSGSDIVVNFSVPVAPLRFDYAYTGYRDDHGFSFYDSTASAHVTGATITGPAQVTVHLSAAPTGANQALHYATQNAGSPVKLVSAGNLVDSDTAESLLGITLQNFAPSFSIAIT